jgi:hypothetical protein
MNAGFGSLLSVVGWFLEFLDDLTLDFGNDEVVNHVKVLVLLLLGNVTLKNTQTCCGHKHPKTQEG